MITQENLPAFSNTQQFKDYYFENSTEKRKILGCMAYELKIRLECKQPDQTKRNIYRVLAEKYGGVSFQYIEDIANSKKFKSTLNT